MINDEYIDVNIRIQLDGIGEVIIFIPTTSQRHTVYRDWYNVSTGLLASCVTGELLSQQWKCCCFH